MKILELSRGGIALIDDEDYDKVCPYKWRIGYDGYVVTTAINPNTHKKGTVRLHQMILPNLPEGFQVDHIDHIKAHCCKSNLRAATSTEQNANRRKETKRKTSSKYKGVWKVHNRWRAAIIKDRIVHSLGYHDTEEQGAEAYNRQAKKLFGPFALLNVIV